MSQPSRLSHVHLSVFSLSLVMLCWYSMMAVHEMGHVFGAMMTGGQIRQVVLHPLTVSRTDVYPNPHPAIVVWLGPIMGCLLPVGLLALVPRSNRIARGIAQFFAGFCLIANGAYIGLGSFAHIGDCGEMVQTGTPLWLMLLFGAIATPSGLMLWHRMGSMTDFFRRPAEIPLSVVYATAAILAIFVVVSMATSPR